ncbi:MAG: heavy-metal-associated domain-containing protein [Caldicoprobacterales bacterium]|jgi:copper chaperone|nr:heavy-metal-associated domain-containing protein [Clostridiales bacterium]
MTKTLHVEGMSCNNCVRHVEEALKEVSGVKSAKADLKSKSAVIELTQDIEDKALIEAVEEAGYKVTGIQ